MLSSLSILGVSITTATESEVVEAILDIIKHKRQGYIVTPNPEILVYAYHHQKYKEILNNAVVAIPDGAGVMWGARFLGNPLKQRITGTDLMEQLCAESVKHEYTIGLLGGWNGVAEKTAEVLKSKYPGMKIGFVGEEWHSSGEGVERRAEGNNSKLSALSPKLDILFVAFGHPKQEEWIAENLEKLPVNVAMGVGGAFDYISGNVPRAPKIVRTLGLEWLFRLIRQPWRWKRQLALIEFINLVVIEKKKNKNK